MKEITIEIGGRTLPLVFNMLAWAEIEENISPIADLSAALSGPKAVRIVNRLISILARAGGADDVTEKWVLANAKPTQLREMTEDVMAAISAGMGMESTEQDEGGEVDVTLKEINKKKEPEG